LYSVLEEKPEPAEDPYLVEISSADIEWFRTMWRKRMGREPTVEEMRGQVNQLIREQILSREAISMGLDDDIAVRRRLAQKMDFLFKDLSDITEPSHEELQAYLQEKRSIYEIPGQLTFTQIYFNTDKRGEKEAAEAARQVVEKLNSKKSAPVDVSVMGDPFLLPSRYSDSSIVKIRGEFGPEFASTIRDQKPGTWQGPVASGYGLHAVYVHELSDTELPDFNDIKERLREDWISEKQRELARQAYEKLRKRYRVLLEGMPYEMDIKGE
jgi:hypothetical protein